MAGGDASAPRPPAENGCGSDGAEKAGAGGGLKDGSGGGAKPPGGGGGNAGAAGGAKAGAAGGAKAGAGSEPANAEPAGGRSKVLPPDGPEDGVQVLARHLRARRRARA